ncbi:MAG TPA: LPS export ABC transporter periplasmic protein LptC [Candidatus Sulfotelmatobacter sp.]|nr:LPS export ABC transporter periplasmic protein LptC [Candidatus Sulfotelmatobacter sp.]
MPLPIYRLRRLLAATAIIIVLAVAGMYFYARSRATNVLKTIPKKIGYDIKQTARGFEFSRSDGKRTLFTVEASDVKEFKLNGNAELHNVNIVLYGRDSSRYDQIYGDDFAYNQKTGDITAMGDVSIDLVSNPAGLASPDQSTPKELKNPIHLKTRDLVFNKNTGNASTTTRVEFRSPQASGWAVGAKYAGKNNELTLSSNIHLELTGPEAAVIEAQHGVITNDPRQIVLDHPHLDRESGSVQAEQAIFSLNADNHVERVLATGNVTTRARTVETRRSPPQEKQSAQSQPSGQPVSAEMIGHADRAEFFFSPNEDLLRSATLSGNVQFEQTGIHAMQGDAGRVILDFAGRNQVQKVHALDNVHLLQKAADDDSSAKAASSQQDVDVNAAAIDFTIVGGHVLHQAVTSGAAQITIDQQDNASAHPSAQHTVVTAGKFTVDFTNSDGHNRLADIHGAPDARIVNSTQGQADRISTSDFISAAFLSQGGIESITQTGHVTYSDGQGVQKRMQAWADIGRYTPADQMLLLTGNPRVANGGMATTADKIRIDRATGDALADGNVKSTYNDVKEDPNGALLASSSPIHVTSQSMVAHNAPAIALYKGNARLWQDANVIEANTIQFDRDHRSVVASGTPTKSVQTILVQPEKAQSDKMKPAGSPTEHPNQLTSAKLKDRNSPITITSIKVTYADSDRRVHYEGRVLAKAADFTASANTADAYLLPRSQTESIQSVGSPGQLDRMVAEGNVVIQQPNRRAEGQKLVYTAAEDKFVLTGGPPSIFDAEQGKITGVSLTFFRRDDRVLVEGEASSPVVTQTRITR